MQVIAGTFGISGSAFIAAGSLHVESVKKGSYKPEDISGLIVQPVIAKGFSIIKALIGAFLLGIILGALLGLIGLVVGVVVGVLGGFYRDKVNAVDINFKDGNQIRLGCTKRAVNKLIRFKG